MHPEDVRPYSGESPKGEQVETMFNHIAPSYDFMNAAMTFGLHRRWLRKALDALDREAPEPPRAILDLATGTGDVALKLAERFGDAEILGVDLSEGMLAIARDKAADANRRNISFQRGDCLALDLPDNSFDMLTIAYGVRNFEDLNKGFREFFRVLRPGGTFMILELSRPERQPARIGYDLYSRCLIPLAGRIVSKDRKAYSYLPQSIAAMPPRRHIAAMLQQTGFKDVRFKSLTLGAVTYYTGHKP